MSFMRGLIDSEYLAQWQTARRIFKAKGKVRLTFLEYYSVVNQVLGILGTLSQ